MYQGTTLEWSGNESSLLYVHQVVGQLGKEETFRWTALEDQVCRSVVVDKLSNIAALFTKRAEALHILVLAVDPVTDRDHHTS
jgi:hypothetical protein